MLDSVNKTDKAGCRVCTGLSAGWHSTAHKDMITSHKDVMRISSTASESGKNYGRRELELMGTIPKVISGDIFSTISKFLKAFSIHCMF